MSFGWIGYRLSEFDRIPRRCNCLGDRTPFCFIAVQQHRVAVTMADQCQLPRQIDRVLQTAVHSVTLCRGTYVRRVPGQKDTTRPEPRRYLRLTEESCGVRNTFETDCGQVVANGGRSVGDKVGADRRWPQVDPPFLTGKCRKNDWDLIQINVIRLVGSLPSYQRRVEHGPGLRSE